jgi:hypothetical protein
MYGGCPREFANEEIKAAVTQELWEKYKKFMIQKMKFGNPTIPVMNCPYPDCQEILEIDPTGLRMFVECANNHQSCSKCKSLSWHNEQSCENVNINI